MRILFIILLMLGSTVTRGKTIVVDKAGGGDHTTITSGYRATVPGDTVLVKDGLYDEHVSVGSANAGTPGNPVVIKAENRHQARVKRFLLSAGYITIDGFEIANSPGHGIGNTGSKYVRAINNHVHDCVEYGIQGGKYGYVAFNTVERTKRSVLADEHTLVESNRLLDLHEGTGDAHIFVYFRGDSVTIRNNFMWDDTTWGDFTRTHEPARDMLFENNKCFNAKHGSESEPSTKGEQVRFTYRNNLFVNCFMVGIWVKPGTEQVSSINNTFVNCGTYAFKLNNTYDPGNVAKNNIIYYFGSRKYGFNQYNPNLGISGPGVYPPETDYNLYYGTPGDKMSYNADYPKDLPSANEFTADPLFVKLPPADGNAYYVKNLADTAEWDLRLQSGSPAIDAGTDAGLAVDFAGNDRPAGAGVDIGAIEYGATSPVSRDPWQAESGRTVITISPLPISNGRLTVQGAKRLGAIRIYDAAGNCAWEGETDAVSVTVPLYTAGSGRYFLVTEEARTIQTFIIIK